MISFTPLFFLYFTWTENWIDFLLKCISILQLEWKSLTELWELWWKHYLRIPDALRKRAVQWVGPGFIRSHPECGIITWATRTVNASSKMIRFNSCQEQFNRFVSFDSSCCFQCNLIESEINEWITSHDDKFHKTPVTSSWTSGSGLRVSNLTRDGIPPALCSALLFSSFCLP